jgi:DNA-directed RNA polymerase specialized sigma subunit
MIFQVPKNNIDQLIEEHKKLIESEAFKAAQFVPLSIVQVEAYKLAREAAESYDPSSGVKFSTYLVNNLKKLSRISTQYGNIARLPENKQFKLQRINSATKSLTEKQGYEPSAQEVADETGMNLQTVKGLLSSKKTDINFGNLAYSPAMIEDDTNHWIHFVYHDLPPQDKLIFEHKTGYAGKAILSDKEIAEKLGIPATTIAHRVRLITNKINEGLE